MEREEAIQMIKSARDKGEAPNLRGANLSGVDFSQLDLYGADLSETNLSEADLHGANLGDADLGETVASRLRTAMPAQGEA